LKYFQKIVSYFIRLGNNDEQGYLEMRRLISCIDACISDVNNVDKTAFVLEIFL